MIVPDANLLLYAYDSTATQHIRAAKWLERTLSGTELVGLPWQCIAAFLRISTNTTLPGQRYTPEEACKIIESWLGQPQVMPLSPDAHHWSHLQRSIIDGQARGPLVSDAQLAALTIEHGGVLHTTDRDFSRFPGLRWINPLT